MSLGTEADQMHCNASFKMLVVFWFEGTINFWAYLKIITHIELLLQ